MNYYYTQKTGGTEAWRPIREDKLDTLDSPMFITVLSVDTPISDDATKEQLAETKYKGPLYFDLDDANSPASTAMYAQKLVEKLSEQGVFPAQLEIFATGGKGFHVLVPEECFLTKPPKTGLPLLPAIFKEMAFGLAVDSMDFRVYTARKGRMFRRANVLRPNGLYKVRISAEELEAMAELAKEDPEAAEANYKELCSAPRKDLEVAQDTPELATGLLAMFDAAKAKITKAAAKIKKQRPVKFPAELPSFDAMLRGEGIKSDTGFHPIAMQVAITAHARGMTLQDLLAKSEGLCENHESDGYRYNTPAKRRAELSRMYDYTDDNPCYTYNPHAIRDLLTHGAPDLHGLEVTAEEVLEGMQAGSDSDEDSNSEFDHANVIMTRQGIFTMTEAGPKQLTAAAFTGVIELRSGEDGGIVALEADMTIGAKAYNGMTLTLEDFSSVNSFNKMLMRFGQTFSGTDIQSRGAYMRIVEKARKEGKSMYVIAKEGLSVVKIPFHEDDQAKQGFLVWADNKQVIVEPSMADKGMALKFVGFPEKAGQFQTDLSSAPNLVRWLAEDQNKDQLRSFLNNLLYCQSPAYLGKLLGWTMACHYRAMFHEAYGKFPMLHINGAAGAGKCFAKDTLILMSDGTTKPVQDVQVGDRLLGPDGTPRNVLSLGRGREAMYRVDQCKGDSYTVNESHILTLKVGGLKPLRLTLRGETSTYSAGDIVNITVKDYLASNTKVKSGLKGWKSGELEFPTEKEELALDSYWLGAWIGDGKSAGPMLCKPDTALARWWVHHAESKGHVVTEGNSGTCKTWGIANPDGPNLFTAGLRKYNLIGNKHIPWEYKTSSRESRLKMLAGLIDSDGTVNNAGYRFDTVNPSLAEDVAFIARSLGIRATVNKDVYFSNMMQGEHTMYHVNLTGDVAKVPTLDKKAQTRMSKVNPTLMGITVSPVGVGDYYGFEIDGDRLLLGGDFTAYHNTEMTKLFANLHYYTVEPKMLTPTSTLFAVTQAVAGSASVPLVLDEFKPAEMLPAVYDKFKLVLRDAYNSRVVERGGGTRESADYRSVHRTQLSAPICFIAEAAESESALMERVVLLTLVKPPVIRAQEYFSKFTAAVGDRAMLGIIGHYCSAQIVNRMTVKTMAEEFLPIYNQTRRELMLQADDENLTPEEFAKRSGAKERTVFNYSVCKYGLVKLQNLIRGIYGNEFDKVFGEMLETVCSTVEEIQAQTVPEWLKVLNTFADMTLVEPLSPYFLIEGKDYAYTTVNGKNCIELYARACYFKYRAYCAASRSKPLFPSESAFTHALGNLSSLVSKGVSYKLDAPGGSVTLDLAELRSSGFMAP